MGASTRAINSVAISMRILAHSSGHHGPVVAGWSNSVTSRSANRDGFLEAAAETQSRAIFFKLYRMKFGESEAHTVDLSPLAIL